MIPKKKQIESNNKLLFDFKLESEPGVAPPPTPTGLTPPAATHKSTMKRSQVIRV